MDGLRPAALAGDGDDWASPAAPEAADEPAYHSGTPTGFAEKPEKAVLNIPLRDCPSGENNGVQRHGSGSPGDSGQAEGPPEPNSWTVAAAAPVHSTSLVNHDATFQPLPPEQVSLFLEARGFLARDELTWRLSKPRDWANFMPAVSFSVKRHEEAGAHTWYAIETELLLPHSERKMSWQAPRRLAHLRDFHDHLKKLLGQENYDNMFLDRVGHRVHFASRGGVPGTTARLDSWLSALAVAINYGRTSPTVVALVLHFLRAPAFPMDPEIEQEEEVEAFSPTNLAFDEPHPESPHPHHPGPAM